MRHNRKEIVARHETLYFYVLSHFIPVALLSLLFFSLTVVLIDLLMNLWKFMQEGAAARDVAFVYLLYIPKALWYAAPLACLFASSLTLSTFYSQNEMTALFASGVPLFRFCAPIIVVCALCAPLLFLFDDAVSTPAFARKKAMQRTLLHEERSLDSDKPVVLCDGGKIIYRAQYYNDDEKRLYNPLFIFRDDSGHPLAIIQARSARYLSDSLRWEADEAVQYTYTDGNFAAAKEGADEVFLSLLTEVPSTFRASDAAVDEVTAAAAREYIAHLMNSGLPYTESLSLYYKKYSFPCVLFIVALLAAGLSGRTRKNISLASLSLCVCFAVLFYVFQMITMLMAKFGVLSPFLGAWLPVAVFTAVCIASVATMRT